MKLAALNNIAEINPRLDRKSIANQSEIVSFVTMADVSEVTGAITHQTDRLIGEVIKGFTPFKDQDVLIAKITPCFENGKIIHARLRNSKGFGSTEFHVVRANRKILDERYLFHFLRQKRIRIEGKRRMTGSAGQRRVPQKFIEDLKLNLPSLPEQKRIAAILDKPDTLREKCRQAIAKLDELLQSVFLDMFGDPVTNPKGWDTIKLTEVGGFISGATPSKEVKDYWNGNIPWVSPKDMKVDYITDSIDHVTETAFRQTNLKRIGTNCLLIVVRGMILAHSFPTAINKVEISINQDMKAIVPSKDFDVLYLKAAFDSLKKRILAAVSVAAHGTMRLDKDDMEKIRIPIPPFDKQTEFRTIANKLMDTRCRFKFQLSHINNLFSSLQNRAFKGEL